MPCDQLKVVPLIVDFDADKASGLGNGLEFGVGEELGYGLGEGLECGVGE